ncbi:YihY/virulence factor BrkB family protein [Gilvimarinus sp. F26214L]|uniref:YihY/virulence factor BrkB family protein n=1 Tax=Gilvimarinus sp. DZF01 TaxID=3461371 RepID=UPI0040468067
MARASGYAPDYGMANRDYRAQSPREISFKGWIAVVKRVAQQIGVDHISIIAAGVAFNVFLALFPLIIAAVSIYGLIIDPDTLQQHLSTMASVLPSGAQEMMTGRLQSLVQTSDQTLGVGLLVSLLVTLWAANRGTKAMFEGINIAYDIQESRNFIVKNAITLLFTVGGLIFGGICLALLVGIPALADALPLPEFLITIIKLAVWPLLFLMLVIGLGLIYKVAPVRRNPRAKWVTVGSLVAAVIWILGSAAFSYFVANFASYDKTYGSLAAVVVLMLWLFLTSFIVVLGAEINSEVEMQTAEDTTVGKDRPMGEREAYQADHVAQDP